MRSFEMKKQDKMIEEYDFSKGIRGKYAEQYNDYLEKRLRLATL